MTAPGLSQSANDVVKSAMRLLHLIDPGETPTTDEANDGLMVLNQMLDGWQIDGLMLFTKDISDFTFVPGTQSYTLGTGGTFNASRPTKIDAASVVLSPLSSNPIELPITYTTDEKQWQEILLKSVTTTYPWFVYDTGDFPLRILKFWPIPGSAHAVRLYMWHSLSQFADLTTSYLFPPGYAETIRYNLAIRLAGEFGGQLDPTIPTMAQLCLSRLKSSNVEVGLLSCDDAVSMSGRKGTAPWSSDIPPIY